MESETLESIEQRGAVDRERGKQAVDQAAGERARRSVSKPNAPASVQAERNQAESSSSSAQASASSAASTSSTTGKNVNIYA